MCCLGVYEQATNKVRLQRTLYYGKRRQQGVNINLPGIHGTYIGNIRITHFPIYMN